MKKERFKYSLLLLLIMQKRKLLLGSMFLIPFVVGSLYLNKRFEFVRPVDKRVEEESFDRHFEIRLDLPKWDRKYEDFSKYTKEAIEGRIMKELRFFSEMSGVPLEKLYNDDNVIFVFFYSELCGACPYFKKDVADPFEDKKKAIIINFWNTFDKEASGLYKLVCNGYDKESNFVEGVPSGVAIKNREVVYRIPLGWYSKKEKVLEDLCSIADSWK